MTTKTETADIPVIFGRPDGQTTPRPGQRPTGRQDGTLPSFQLLDVDHSGTSLVGPQSNCAAKSSATTAAGRSPSPPETPPDSRQPNIAAGANPGQKTNAAVRKAVKHPSAHPITEHPQPADRPTGFAIIDGLKFFR